MGNAFAQWKQPAGKGLGWYTGEDGFLYVDNMKVCADVLAPSIQLLDLNAMLRWRPSGSKSRTAPSTCTARIG